MVLKNKTVLEYQPSNTEDLADLMSVLRWQVALRISSEEICFLGIAGAVQSTSTVSQHHAILRGKELLRHARA